MNRIKINDGQNIFVVYGVFIDGIIKYVDLQENVCNIYIEENVKITKKGNINMEFIHILHENKQLNYTVNIDNQNMKGSSMIETTKIEVNEKKIVIHFIRDGEKVINTWEKL